MDPLTITTAVVGLLQAVPAIIDTVKKFIDRTQDAPYQARVILQEATDFDIILSQLQSFLLHQTPANTDRSDHILVGQIILTLTGSILTFSDLQVALEGLKIPNNDQTILDGAKWVRKEGKIAKIIQRLQYHKASLGCMLNIMNVQSINEVHESVTNLANLIGELLKYNPDLIHRMASLESPQSADGVTMAENRESQIPRSGFSREIFKSAFGSVRKVSRVYRRTSPRKAHLSLSSTDAPSTSWSVLSGLSMSQISNVSVLTLPLVPAELFDANQYNPPEVYAVARRDDFRAAESDKIDSNAKEPVVVKSLKSSGDQVPVPISDLKISNAQTGGVLVAHKDSLEAIREAGILHMQNEGFADWNFGFPEAPPPENPLRYTDSPITKDNGGQLLINSKDESRRVGENRRDSMMPIEEQASPVSRGRKRVRWIDEEVASNGSIETPPNSEITPPNRNRREVQQKPPELSKRENAITAFIGI